MIMQNWSLKWMKQPIPTRIIEDGLIYSLVTLFLVQNLTDWTKENQWKSGSLSWKDGVLHFSQQECPGTNPGCAAGEPSSSNSRERLQHPREPERDSAGLGEGWMGGGNPPPAAFYCIACVKLTIRGRRCGSTSVQPFPLQFPAFFAPHQDPEVQQKRYVKDVNFRPQADGSEAIKQKKYPFLEAKAHLKWTKTL